MDPLADINTLADQCVKCGLCLPHCPTYRLAADEAESPRGRIALIHSLRDPQYRNDPSLLQHLDTCLQCRHCEGVCPSQVQYARLYRTGYRLLQQTQQRRYSSVIARLLAQRGRLRVIMALLWGYQRLGFRALLRITGLLRLCKLSDWDRKLPDLSFARLPRQLKPTRPSCGRIAILSGCLGDYLEHRALLATAKLAVTAGYRVDFIPPQCCGALLYQRGDLDPALRSARRLLAAIDADDFDAIVFLNSGCGAHWQQYATLPWSSASERDRAQRFSTKLFEACRWVHDFARAASTAALQTSVRLHLPCSHRNSLGDTEVITALLQTIPGLTLQPLGDRRDCCGAAGDYALRHPKRAAELRDGLLQPLQNDQADFLLTTNLGCALHLRAGLAPSTSVVLHPLSFYAQACGIDLSVDR